MDANPANWLSKIVDVTSNIPFISPSKPKVIRWADDEDKENTIQLSINNGRIKFVGENLESRDIKMEASYFLIDEDTIEYVDNVATEMSFKWNMHTPKVVLSIISSSEYFRPWKRQQDEDDFQEGLMTTSRLTDLWVVTEGLNSGVGALIGKAVANERARRKIFHTEQKMVRFLSEEILPRLTVIGLVDQEDLSTEMVTTLLDGTKPGNIPPSHVINSKGDEQQDEVQQLNPNLTHFFVLSPDVSLHNFMFRLEMRFRKPVGRGRAYSFSDDEQEHVSQTPLVGLLIQGGPRDIYHTLSLLQKNVPVIVVCGQGMAADILAFALRSTQKVADLSMQESYIKTELLQQISKAFPYEFKNDLLARNLFRDKILECINYATQGDTMLLTLLDIQVQKSSFKDLSKVILTSLLSSRTGIQGPENLTHIKVNLQLTIDWKRPDLAISEIYNKYNKKISVADAQFQQVLLGYDRQEFVELFLDRGFILHKYLNSRRLELLFKLCKDRAFFAEICLETVLGQKITLMNPIPTSFLSGNDCLLNRLLATLTGIHNLIDPLQLSLNASVDRVETSAQAEQRALHALIYWAALTYNTKLLLILWGRTNEPMVMALLLSTLFNQLAKTWITDPDLQKRTDDIGIEYGKLAVKMLNMNFHESKVQALESLTNKLPDFQKNSAIDLAVISKNKFFIAHPCCQKYISERWYGSIRIQKRKLGFIELPDIVKIFLCLILIFPAFIWIDIVNQSRTPASNMKRTQLVRGNFLPGLSNTTGNLWSQKTFFLVKLYYIWIAPITQFWMSQLFFVAFLALFAYSLSQPYCGEPLIHMVLVMWLVVLFLDNLHGACAKKARCRDYPISSNIRMMLVLAYTTALVIIFRVLQLTYVSFTTGKFLLAINLVYLSYYVMSDFYPVSRSLGPMLVNIQVMIKRDLMNWLKMFFLSLIGGSVAMHAVMYPAEPFDFNVAFRTIVRGIFALFMTDLSGLEGDSCTCLYNHTKSFGCDDHLIPNVVRDNVASCPYKSLGGYAVVLQYIYQTKLIYNTLIFAMCSVTMASTYTRALEIWKYQFFMLVQEFDMRPPLPVPLVILVYPAMVLKSIFLTIYRLLQVCCPCLRKAAQRQNKTYNVWNAIIKLHKKEEKMNSELANIKKITENRLAVLAEEQKQRNRLITSLNDRLVEVMNNQMAMFLILEQLKNVLDTTTKKKSATLHLTHHINCRRSPYPSTAIRRFAVFDKFLSWEEAYPNYDPPIFSKPLQDYDEELRLYMDPDWFVMEATRQMYEAGTEQNEKSDLNLPGFKPKFNEAVESKTISGEIFTIDRVSWITKAGQPLQYVLDSSGIPRNPVGRTGIRGRGNLWRYGPNHMMMAIVSRWKSNYNSDGVAQGYLSVNGKKVKEIIVTNNAVLKEDILPTGFVSGRTSKFSVMCEVFAKEVLGEKDIQGSVTFSQEEMIQYFRQFLSSDNILSGILGTLTPGGGLRAKMLYRGYLDNPSNTDNAWVEVEVWSFNYHSFDNFDRKIHQRDTTWREVSKSMQLTACHLPFVLEMDSMYND